MTKPEKPRPSLDDTLARIDLTLADNEIHRVVIPVDGRFTITTPGVYQFGGTVHPYGKPRPAEPHLVGAPGPTCPGCAARDAQPGWLARVLDRLFGDGAR